MNRLLVPALMLLTMALTLTSPVLTDASASGFGFLQVFGGSKPDVAYRVAYVNSSIYVVGYTMTLSDSPNGCGFLLLLNETGAYRDLKVYCAFSYAYEELVDIAVYKDSLYVLGNTRYLRRETRDFESDIVIAKLDSEGGVVWSIILGRPGVSEVGSSIHITGSRLYIAGSSNDNALLMALDLDGAVIWSREIDLGYLEKGVAVKTYGDLIYLLTRSYNKAHGYIRDFVFIVDQAGSLLGGVSLEPNHYHTSLQLSRTGDLYLSGWVIDYSAKTTIGFVKKLDYNLRPVWARRFPSIFNNSVVYDLSIDETGYIYATGRVSDDAFVLKITPLGSALWIKTLRNARGTEEFYGIISSRGVSITAGVTTSWSDVPYYTAAMVMSISDDHQSEYVDHSRIQLESFTARTEITGEFSIIESQITSQACSLQVTSLGRRFAPRVVFSIGSPPEVTYTPEPTTTPVINIPAVTVTVTEYITISHLVTTTVRETMVETLTITITLPATSPQESLIETISITQPNTMSSPEERVETTNQPINIFTRGLAELIGIAVTFTLFLGAIALLVYLINALSRYLKRG